MKKRLILTSLLTLALVVALITTVVGCAGEQGLKGDQGPMGLQGIQGEQGESGPAGLQGEQGEPGPKGSTGAKGVAGPAGAKGAQGIQGEQGPAGPAGVGARGAMGATGATGLTGATGTKGDTGPAFSNLGILLYVEDGTKKIAHVTYILDEPIALADLTELTFFQELVYGSGRIGANVILGIDVNGDGYEADDLAWHFGHNLTALGGDTFIAMDGVDFYTNPKKVDALTIGKWWTPNTTGDGLSGQDFGFNIPPALYCSFSDLLTRIDEGGWDTNVPNTSVQVSLIRLVVGGSGSWMDTAFRVTSDMIPSEVGVYSQ